MYSDSFILEAKKIMRIDRQQYLETNKTSLTLIEDLSAKTSNYNARHLRISSPLSSSNCANKLKPSSKLNILE